ncbi:hypothetical protein MML48_1g04112 [Holotrichia oblita]|uniref:Uncharacterized protein n=1 Tax=Holotrichia oblita TaxID=644536 RepID=A0ACB9TYR8_HOLOL|nr:hypothetical protein MML48_1g04112 [Holotrichia oblita]
MNMAGYLKTPAGAHGHFPAHPGLGAGIGSGLAGMPMPALGHFGIGHSLDSVPFPQGMVQEQTRKMQATTPTATEQTDSTYPIHPHENETEQTITNSSDTLNISTA